MNERQTFLCAADLCRLFAQNLAELPGAGAVALECAAILEEASKLAPTVAENGVLVGGESESRPKTCQAFWSLLT